MNINPSNPVIVQGDGKVLLETQHARFDEARDFLARFAELESSPDLLHTYRITPLSLWNAASAGMDKEAIVSTLRELSKFDVPDEVREKIENTIGRYGLIQLHPHPKDNGVLRVTFATLYVEKLAKKTQAGGELLQKDGKRFWMLDKGMRGLFKQRMLLEEWPIEDLAGFADGDPLPMRLRSKMVGNGKPFAARDYQVEAVRRWYMDGQPAGGHGVVVLP